jgi:hypothetical protein
MVPQLIARVDGLPVSLLAREQVWPAANSGQARSKRILPRRRRAEIDRQTAAVREGSAPQFARGLLDAEALVVWPYGDLEHERFQIRGDLAAAGLL